MKLYCFILLFMSSTIQHAFAQTAADYYIPLQVDNKLVFYSAGNQQGWDARTVIESINGTDTINGQLFYRLEGIEIMDDSPGDSSIFHTFWLNEGPQGNILIGAVSRTKSNELDSATVYETPQYYFHNSFLTSGYSQSVFNDGIYYLDTVISTTDLVNTPAGTFSNCIQIMQKRMDTTGTITWLKYFYYAEGIGEVKQVQEIPENKASTHELISYNIITSVDETDILALPHKFNLYQNYPNPFNPSTRLTYSIPQADYVVLSVYDLTGKIISTLVNEYQKAGKYSINFRRNNLSSGIYFYQLQVGKSYATTKKMLLIK